MLNDLVALLNTALKKWNDLKFEAGGFHKTIPAWTPLIGGKSFGWDPIKIGTTDIPLVQTLPKFSRGGRGGGRHLHAAELGVDCGGRRAGSGVPAVAAAGVYAGD